MITNRILNSKSHKAPAYGMDYDTLPDDQTQAIRDVSMDIYVDMLNAGHSIQETISAIYYSGIKHAIMLPKLKAQNDRT